MSLYSEQPKTEEYVLIASDSDTCSSDDEIVHVKMRSQETSVHLPMEDKLDYAGIHNDNVLMENLMSTPEVTAVMENAVVNIVEVGELTFSKNTDCESMSSIESFTPEETTQNSPVQLFFTDSSVSESCTPLLQDTVETLAVSNELAENLLQYKEYYVEEPLKKIIIGDGDVIIGTIPTYRHEKQDCTMAAEEASDACEEPPVKVINEVFAAEDPMSLLRNLHVKNPAAYLFVRDHFINALKQYEDTLQAQFNEAMGVTDFPHENQQPVTEVVAEEVVAEEVVAEEVVAEEIVAEEIVAEEIVALINEVFAAEVVADIKEEPVEAPEEMTAEVEEVVEEVPEEPKDAAESDEEESKNAAESDEEDESGNSCRFFACTRDGTPIIIDGHRTTYEGNSLVVVEDAPVDKYNPVTKEENKEEDELFSRVEDNLFVIKVAVIGSDQHKAERFLQAVGVTELPVNEIILSKTNRLGSELPEHVTVEFQVQDDSFDLSDVHIIISVSPPCAADVQRFRDLDKSQVLWFVEDYQEGMYLGDHPRESFAFDSTNTDALVLYSNFDFDTIRCYRTVERKHEKADEYVGKKIAQFECGLLCWNRMKDEDKQEFFKDLKMQLITGRNEYMGDYRQFQITLNRIIKKKAFNWRDLDHTNTRFYWDIESRDTVYIKDDPKYLEKYLTWIQLQSEKLLTGILLLKNHGLAQKEYDALIKKYLKKFMAPLVNFKNKIEDLRGTSLENLQAYHDVMSQMRAADLIDPHENNCMSEYLFFRKLFDDIIYSLKEMILDAVKNTCFTSLDKINEALNLCDVYKNNSEVNSFACICEEEYIIYVFHLMKGYNMTSSDKEVCELLGCGNRNFEERQTAPLDDDFLDPLVKDKFLDLIKRIFDYPLSENYGNDLKQLIIVSFLGTYILYIADRDLSSHLYYGVLAYCKKHTNNLKMCAILYIFEEIKQLFPVYKYFTSPVCDPEPHLSFMERVLDVIV